MIAVANKVDIRDASLAPPFTTREQGLMRAVAGRFSSAFDDGTIRSGRAFKDGLAYYDKMMDHFNAGHPERIRIQMMEFLAKKGSDS